jgi:hypothetical protein
MSGNNKGKIHPKKKIDPSKMGQKEVPQTTTPEAGMQLTIGVNNGMVVVTFATLPLKSQVTFNPVEAQRVGMAIVQAADKARSKIDVVGAMPPLPPIVGKG